MSKGEFQHLLGCRDSLDGHGYAGQTICFPVIELFSCQFRTSKKDAKLEDAKSKDAKSKDAK